jgi:hypothetical protein
VGCSGEGTEDVAVGACAADPAGGKPVASGIIVNQSSKPSTYVIRIAFFDSDGNRVSEGVDSVGRVEPGQRAQWNASGAANATGTLRCEATATRSEAPGG